MEQLHIVVMQPLKNLPDSENYQKHMGLCYVSSDENLTELKKRAITQDVRDIAKVLLNSPAIEAYLTTDSIVVQAQGAPKHSPEQLKALLKDRSPISAPLDSLLAHADLTFMYKDTKHQCSQYTFKQYELPIGNAIVYVPSRPIKKT